LGLLNSITEEEEKEKGLDDENSSSTVRNSDSYKKSKTRSSVDSKQQSPIYDNGINGSKFIKAEKSFEVKNYIEGQIESLLKVLFSKIIREKDF